jgi:hypothetical protein
VVVVAAAAAAAATVREAVGEAPTLRRFSLLLDV